jgi:Tfp pilus assembly protein PilO
MGTLENSERKVEFVKIAKQEPNKKSEMIFTGLTYIVAILLIVFAIVPTFKTVQRINSEIKSKEVTTEALKNKLVALTSLDSQYAQNKEIFDGISLVFPNNEDFSLFLANIDSIVSRNAFALNSIGFSKIKENSQESTLNFSVLKPYSISLNVAGNKSGLIPFLNDLEALPMYPIIEGISYSNQTDTQGNTNYSISLRVYNIEEVNFYSQ